MVAVLRAPEAAAYLPVVRALADAGVVSIELTLTTPDTVRELPRLIEAVPHAELGVGTVLTRDQAISSLDAGAAFLVTPAVRSDVIEIGVERGVPVLCGALTPTEAYTAWELGASAVKVFPAATVGTEYIRHLSGPFPDLKTVPSGGVGLGDIAGWINAGSTAVSLGGPLLGRVFDDGDLANLGERARQAIAEASGALR